MFKINAKSMRLSLLAAAILAIGSGLLAQNQPDGQKEIRPKGPGARPKPAPEKQVHPDRYGDPLPDGAHTRLGTLRFRAPAEITALAYAADGKTVAVSTNSGLFLFDAISGKKLRHLAGFQFTAGWRNLLVFSPDGKRLAASGKATVKEGKEMPTKGAVFI